MNPGLQRKVLFFLIDCLIAHASIAHAQATFPADFSVVPPNISQRTFKLTDFGAVGDGKTLNTTAITQAISTCNKAGGGVLDVPPGTYLTGPFELCSSLDLHLEAGATILLTGSPKDFDLEGGSFQNCISLKDGHDIAITGAGTIDGQGAYFWHHYVAPKDVDPKKYAWMPRRPKLILLTRCVRVLVRDVTLQNSPMFHLVPSMCREVLIENIHIHSPVPSPNTDGIDPSGFDYLIRGCTIDTGDDCIAVKGGERYDPARPSCENILVTNCAFLHGHGMSIGSETYGGVRNMLVRDCSFDGTEAGIRLKSPRGKGGVTEYLTYENLTMKNVLNSILITSYYPKIPKDFTADLATDEQNRTPVWRHIRINDVVSTGGFITGQIVGLPEMPIEDVVLTNVSVSAAQPIQIAHARGIRFVKCDVSAASGNPVIVDAAVDGLK